MPLSDKGLPVTIAFQELIGKAQETDISEEEKRYLANKEAQRRLFLLHNPGKKTTSEAFLPNEENNEKLVSQIDEELHNQATAKKAAEEKSNASFTGDFPPPPTSSG